MALLHQLQNLVHILILFNILVMAQCLEKLMLNFKPDMLLFCAKNNGSIDHGLFDSTRVVIKLCNLIETILIITLVSDHGIISSFDSDGFTVNNGSSGSYPKLQVNDNSPFGNAAQYITYC